MTFKIFTEDIEARIKSVNKGNTNISHILNSKKHSISEEEFLTLISEEANPYIEKIALRAKQLTELRHGLVKGIYIPLYLSNICHNDCTYCGFSIKNKVRRKALTAEEISIELTNIYNRGYRNILLVSAERNGFSDIDYLKSAVALAKKIGFQSIASEFGAVDTEQASKLKRAGSDSFVLYQETFHVETYNRVHLFGLKKEYQHRLDGVTRAIEGGFQKVTLGFLGGLADYQFEALSLYRHFKYLQLNHWDVQFSLSIPRLNDAEGAIKSSYPVSDLTLTKLLSAFRISFPEMPILLSTRESKELRDGLTQICVTSLSCESKTTPGGYVQSNEELEQFSIDDTRSLTTLVNDLEKVGLEPVFKDWQIDLNGEF
ncbi:hypothetical protein A9Q84_06055 [Halobacteriovorax marinus]|uniref:Radical SAM core domain-containing protein n=1 Tax=Halobacteriovorax marinus TaxID=97084 RepID=A0A1Y5F9D8_9BACT|nr:hypothetical protein A9Q84_06055 [Halobacteriovorax marinus]